MKAISPHTIELIQSLSAPPGVLSRWLRRVEAPPVAILEEIVSSGEIEAALALLALALGGPPWYREPLLGALERLVRAAPPSALAWLEQRARTLSEWRREGWASSSDVRAELARSLPTNPASAAGVASMHASGYVREAAVEVLSVSDDPLAVAFLLIRANDWVAPVRDAAARGIARHLSAGGAASFITYIDLLDGLTRAGRNELQPLAERVRAALAAPASASALKEGCASGSRSVRRRCFEIAFSTRTLDLTRLVSVGLDDPDPLIRILSAKRAKALDWTDVEPLIDDMLASTTPAARFFALEILWNRNGVASRPVQERFALDPHSHVRGTARWLLKTVPDFDSIAFYRRAVATTTSARELVGAIEGLGEVGSADDAALVLPFFHHDRARVRAAAVHAVGSIGAKTHREAMIAALSDPSALVCRTALRVLLRGEPVDPELLTSAALTSRYPHERRAAVDLAVAHDHWVTGILLLRIAWTRDRDTAARVMGALTAWESRYNRVFTKPTSRQVEEFELLVESANVDADLRGRLRALVPSLKLRTR